MVVRLLPIVLIALLSACGSAPVPQGSFFVGGERPALVVVPPDHDPFAPTPLLVVLHGYRSDAEDVERLFPLAVAAEVLGVAVVRPEGTTDRLGNRFWNAAPACCDFFGAGVDDAAYLLALVEEARARMAVSEVILFGHSNGGFMAYALACAQPARFAAVVTIAGALPDPAPPSCGVTGPARLLHLHGSSDWVIGYAGGSISDLPLPGIPDGLPRYLGAGCAPRRLSPLGCCAPCSGCERVPDEPGAVSIHDSVEYAPVRRPHARGSTWRPLVRRDRSRGRRFYGAASQRPRRERLVSRPHHG
jgi:predicted esterase